jgi:hypothetical protein
VAWQKAREVAIARVEKYYDEEIMFKQYQDLYNRLAQHQSS